MKRLYEYAINWYIVIVILSLFFILLGYHSYKSKPRFSTGQCVYNEQFNDHKKIIDVEPFIYWYVMYNSRKKKYGGKLYFTRRFGFEKNHIYERCK